MLLQLRRPPLGQKRRHMHEGVKGGNRRGLYSSQSQKPFPLPVPFPGIPHRFGKTVRVELPATVNSFSLVNHCLSISAKAAIRVV